MRLCPVSLVLSPAAVLAVLAVLSRWSGVLVPWCPGVRVCECARDACMYK
jgi:hypothetical protein